MEAEKRQKIYDKVTTIAGTVATIGGLMVSNGMTFGHVTLPNGIKTSIGALIVGAAGSLWAWATNKGK